jgi:hypothetical protein
MFIWKLLLIIGGQLILQYVKFVQIHQIIYKQLNRSNTSKGYIFLYPIQELEYPNYE